MIGSNSSKLVWTGLKLDQTVPITCLLATWPRQRRQMMVSHVHRPPGPPPAAGWRPGDEGSQSHRPIFGHLSQINPRQKLVDKARFLKLQWILLWCSAIKIFTVDFNCFVFDQIDPRKIRSIGGATASITTHPPLTSPNCNLESSETKCAKLGDVEESAPTPTTTTTPQGPPATGQVGGSKQFFLGLILTVLLGLHRGPITLNDDSILGLDLGPKASRKYVLPIVWMVWNLERRENMCG